MRQAAAFLAIFAALAIPWAGTANAAGSPSDLLGLSYRMDAGRQGDAAGLPAGIAAGGPDAGLHSSALSLPARLEELLLKPEIAVPARMVVSVPQAGPGQAIAYENLWDRIRGGFAMDNLNSPLVDRWQTSYLARPQILKGILERSRRYLFHVVEEASRRGMPLELALLPMVESGYNPVALSSAQASGLWQFIPSTARDYKLHLSPDYDARRDIVASTSAALDYLQDLYDLFGDWRLALAAYNWGEKSVAKAIAQNAARGRRTDFASLALPEETRNYVPKLQALKNLIAYPDAFRLELEPIANEPYFTTVTNNRSIDFAVAARLSGVSLQELKGLNPGHNGSSVSGNAATGLVLPVERADTFLTNFETYKNATSPR
jgi:membrane-bound lytic murein transglycosylase D